MTGRSEASAGADRLNDEKITNTASKCHIAADIK